MYHPKLLLLSFSRPLDCAGPISAPGLVRWMPLGSLGEVGILHAWINSFLLPGSSRERAFSSICSVQSRGGSESMVSISQHLHFAWVVDCAEPIRALGLVTHILVLWVAPSETLGHWACEQTFSLTLIKLGTRGFLSDCMTVLWGRVSGERVP